jgi:hypothetical protein
MYQALIAAARVNGMLHDPSVLTASKWQDWLHPRGKDGRFIEKASAVNIFASENALLSDRTAVRRRAKITDLRPEGAYVTYYDATNLDENGKPTVLPPDDAAGFPALIPVDQLSTKVATAPKEIAHLQPGESAATEVADALVPAMSQKEYDAQISEINEHILEDYPEQDAIVSTGQGPISDEELQTHLEFLAVVEEQYVTGYGLSYDQAFKDSFGLWSEEWQQIFDAVVDEAYDEVTKNQTMPRDNRAIMLGGLPGAGKSSTLDEMRKSGGHFRPDEWITINPDLMKDKMLERDLFPRVNGLAPAETASFIHAASSEMSYMLEQLLTVEGYNLIFDITMGGKPRRPDEKANYEQIVDRLNDLDYQIDGVFVDVDPATSRERVALRHEQGLNALRTGRSKRRDDPEITNGGRVVPDFLIAENEIGPDDPDYSTYKSVNARNFDRMKANFTRWSQWDNTGKHPVFTGGTASDPDDGPNLPGFYPESGEVAA